MFENIHDDWCECWESGLTSPDYSKCDCHLLSIKHLQEVIERGKKANFEQELKIQELELKLSSPAKTSCQDFVIDGEYCA